MKYRIEYLTCQNKWRDFYGRMIDERELRQKWDMAYSQVKHEFGKRFIRLIDENGKDVDA